MQIAKTVGIVIPTQMHFQGVYNLRIKRKRRQKAKLESTGAFLAQKNSNTRAWISGEKKS